MRRVPLLSIAAPWVSSLGLRDLDMDQDAKLGDRWRSDSSSLYTSRIIKAGALLPDTKTLLSHWDVNESVQPNLQRLQRENVFGKASRSRVEDIVGIFRQRYLTEALARFSHGLHTDRRAETSPLCLEQSHVPKLVPRRRRESFAIAPQLDGGTAWPSTTAPRLGYSPNCRAAEATPRPQPA